MRETRRRAAAALAIVSLEANAAAIEEVPDPEPLVERAGPKPSHVFSDCTIWYARTIGTNDAPWLIRTPEGETWLAEAVHITRCHTLLLDDEGRKKLPDSPRGVLICKLVLAYGAQRLNR